MTCILLSGIAFYKNRREVSFFLSLPRMGKAIHTRGEAATTTPNPEP